MSAESLYPAQVDVPVLLIFFTRPDTFEKVFEKVKEARPSKLFLACDGPREGWEDDVKKIAECKKIAENIDWECEVYTNYAETNMGCGMRPQTAIGWALSIVDRIVILEDDCVPDITFFGYMHDLLEKYKDDERVMMISGLNHFKEWDCADNSYFFAKTAAIWGWGTWKRVWDMYDYTVESSKNTYIQRLLYDDIYFKGAGKSIIKRLDKTRDGLNNGINISYWDSQWGYIKYSQNMLGIVPKHNLISNIGIGSGSTHAEKCIDSTAWKPGSVFNIPTENIDLPLKHPPVVICDRAYDLKYYKSMAYPNSIVKNYRRIKRLLKQLYILIIEQYQNNKSDI